MKNKLFSAVLLSSVICIGVPSIVAQNSSTDPGFKQDMKNAGHHTKDAAKDTCNGVKSGTKKTWRKTKRGTKKATHKTARKTDEGARNVERKTEPQ
jgi:hypothetical protein